MTITTSYMTSTRNLEGILTAIQTAQAPDKVTLRFLETLEFKSSTDRLIIGVLKGLQFIDDSGSPTERYYKFLDQSEAKAVLADAIRDAYEDLFRLNVKAYELSETDVKNKLKTLFQGQKSEEVLSDMAKTFKALASLADWSSVPTKKPTDGQSKDGRKSDKKSDESKTTLDQPADVKPESLQLSYNIQIILPATRDTAVYDALFKSLKEHLLR